MPVQILNASRSWVTVPSDRVVLSTQADGQQVVRVAGTNLDPIVTPMSCDDITSQMVCDVVLTSIERERFLRRHKVIEPEGVDLTNVVIGDRLTTKLGHKWRVFRNPVVTHFDPNGSIECQVHLAICSEADWLFRMDDIARYQPRSAKFDKPFRIYTAGGAFLENRQEDIVEVYHLTEDEAASESKRMQLKNEEFWENKERLRKAREVKQKNIRNFERAKVRLTLEEQAAETRKNMARNVVAQIAITVLCSLVLSVLIMFVLESIIKRF